MLFSSLGHASTTKILLVGDSIGAGYGVPESQNWATLLDHQLNNAEIINASISGDTSSGAEARLVRLLDHFKPDLVMIEIGGNDGLRGQPVQLLKDNLISMIQKSRQSGAEVLLLGMRIPPNYGTRYTDAFHQVYHEVAQQHSVTLLPFLLENVALRPELMQQDRIHPNTEAQPLIVQNVLPVLEPLLN